MRRIPANPLRPARRWDMLQLVRQVVTPSPLVAAAWGRQSCLQPAFQPAPDARRLSTRLRTLPHPAWLVLALASTLAAYTASVTPERRAMLGRISAQSLQGHVSFLASDLLEGRDTPSRGLDLAAEYIAAQFRRAGLKPVGDNGYFQTARYKVLEAE